MIPLSFQELQILIAAVAFIMGCLCVLIGIFMLVSRGYSKEVRTIAAHASRLGHKGISHEVTGLVNSAAELLMAINQLVRTASGIGVFLILLGLSLLAASYYVIQQIEGVFS